MMVFRTNWVELRAVEYSVWVRSTGTLNPFSIFQISYPYTTELKERHQDFMVTSRKQINVNCTIYTHFPPCYNQFDRAPRKISHACEIFMTWPDEYKAYH